MFGTIGHFHPKPGSESKFKSLMDEWDRTMRPQIPGKVLQLSGRPKDRPGEVVFIALFQDEATYRDLANKPEQNTWYERMMEMVDGEITWEDVEFDDFRES